MDCDIALIVEGTKVVRWLLLGARDEVDIRVAPGTHATEAAVNKQLNDKERVAAALENPNLVDMVDECLAPSYA
ncbi:Protein ae7 [Datura stramonium]|uniref:Protein ae7 n=1 Tax=Datura stramonium TaxID=4076 RepID=A0ABS8TF97_DATST|nr:Protein ae7 [Datura stramonium]